jgi:hypothetical protein
VAKASLSASNPTVNPIELPARESHGKAVLELSLLPNGQYRLQLHEAGIPVYSCQFRNLGAARACFDLLRTEINIHRGGTYRAPCLGRSRDLLPTIPLVGEDDVEEARRTR